MSQDLSRAAINYDIHVTLELLNSVIIGRRLKDEKLSQSKDINLY